MSESQSSKYEECIKQYLSCAKRMNYWHCLEIYKKCTENQRFIESNVS